MITDSIENEIQFLTENPDVLTRLVARAHLLHQDASVDDIDPRLDYVMVQVDREVWNEFVAAVVGDE